MFKRESPYDEIFDTLFFLNNPKPKQELKNVSLVSECVHAAHHTKNNQQLSLKLQQLLYLISLNMTITIGLVFFSQICISNADSNTVK